MGSFPRVLFDEAHSESWTIRRELAESVNPAHPDDTSYARAAGLLRHLGHTVTAHTTGPLGPGALADQDVLVIAHPSNDRWERTTGQGSPVLADAELDAVEAFVAGGGGLVVLAEEEQDKYGNNVRELLARFGVDVRHTTVRDPGTPTGTWPRGCWGNVPAAPGCWPACGRPASTARARWRRRGRRCSSPPRRRRTRRASRWPWRCGTGAGGSWCSPTPTCSVTTPSTTTTTARSGRT
ncbi:hypothetical protein ACFQ0B_65975 [Nonomuraea thailandensis]